MTQKNSFDIWLVLDLFVNIITMLAVVIILSKYFQGLQLTFFIVLFIVWAFRPIILAFKDFFSSKKQKGEKK